MLLMKLDIALLMGILPPKYFQRERERDVNCRAWIYQNEVELGNALKQCKTPRSEIFVIVFYIP